MRTWIGLALIAAGCNGVSNEEDAERAYLGLDTAFVRGMNLGMTGYNLASSANIDDQVADGDVGGTITVGGQVDQGESDNKELRLDVTLDEYLDEVDFDDDGEPDADFEVTYDTTADPLALDLSLRDLPATGSGTLGTLTGTLTGTVEMSGYLEGDVTLDLDVDGEIEEDPEVAGDLQRVDGTTTIVGTATSDYGTFDVDITR